MAMKITKEEIMSNIKIDLNNCGYTKEQIFEHSQVVEDINSELIVKSKQEEYFGDG